MPASHTFAAPAAENESRRRKEFQRNLKWMKIQSVLFYVLAGLVVGFVLGKLFKGLFA